jgi:WD40 repeat protein
LPQAYGGTDGSLAVYDAKEVAIADATQPEPLVHHVGAHAITALQFRPGRAQLAYGCQDGSLGLWDAAGCLQMQSFLLHKAAITCCSWSKQGGMLAAGDASGLVSIWDLRQAVLLQLYRWAEHARAWVP